MCWHLNLAPANFKKTVKGLFLLLQYCPYPTNPNISSLCAIVQHTVMAKSIGTPALLLDNAPLLPKNGCNYKCFGNHMFISFLFALEQHKKTQRKKSNLM